MLAIYAFLPDSLLVFVFKTITGALYYIFSLYFLWSLITLLLRNFGRVVDIDTEVPPLVVPFENRYWISLDVFQVLLEVK